MSKTVRRQEELSVVTRTHLMFSQAVVLIKKDYLWQLCMTVSFVRSINRLDEVFMIPQRYALTGDSHPFYVKVNGQIYQLMMEVQGRGSAVVMCREYCM